MYTLRDVCIRASDSRGLRDPRTLSSLDVTTYESSSELAYYNTMVLEMDNIFLMF